MPHVTYLVSHYDYRLVVLSIVVAIAACYTTLDIVGRIRAADRRHAYVWLIAGALAMGTGIWSMHFVGMLAFKLPIAMGFNVGLTALSWLMGVSASAVALYLASGAQLTLLRLFWGASFLAAGILGMHYTGMYAMRMTPSIVYSSFWVVLSIVVALFAAAAGLWIAFALRENGRLSGFVQKCGASSLKGAAIVGAHYTAMAGAQFPVGSICGAANGLDMNWLAVLIGASALLLLGMALTAAALDRRLENRTARLVESLRQANAQLQHTSRHDPLTNLANRHLLQERLNEAIDLWRRHGRPFAVVYIDLDGFKMLNDNLGHDEGDRLLVRVGKALRQAVREYDTVARVGGDEFVIVLSDVSNDLIVDRVCQKILAAMPTTTANAVHLSASIGSAHCADHADNADQLLAAADQAMYYAKSEGKNRHARFEAAMASHMTDAFEVQNELDHAIKTDEIVVHYQPQYTTRGRCLAGAEALVRWQHPVKGLIPPDRFIPVAEQCGRIESLETRVLNLVCADIRAWLDAGFAVPRIAVNLSASRIRDPFLPQRIRACLNDWQLDPSYLMFEITESLAIQEILKAVETLKRFTDMGVNVALDDFGTGHSSLSYLKQLPIQQLKIDRMFVTDLGRENDNQIAIVRAIVSLAHALNLHVVAEGVETEAQLMHLVRLECDEVQGYLFSRPIPAQRFIGLLEQTTPAQARSA